ncbi:MAG: hypothetical protein A2821_00700 [Candidatus Magasanikbacteria bacterium RIFCSPHIGHO2_01_FULL_41_23]|uniref:Uncharacterized protein n=1 Tax=Candidatus Magasanikbacteria bacterium RIFCSPLOWO2_01_FULL_40_15 TaxID=1798686 RepID=A0A1F6N0E0_9BACT|nr:MAG: hypothetical protein A2821_00700 [Candidatus Magasanikbacteria bacterium RIFCSPHIGHO2_01_FULL_41_23]OGH74693.1 MAG: hypothetical protein A3F22_02055 [Candidatus Magasanikbacteria bacterium RIFCSPHIGHO2_12_FULL_41_16]OGH77407.1 MAG: hypothetical protein A2983_01755 [Candidatus Magasanikbacteria bacterium RIFCSPLOWO2_01_FULL_40_15]
MPLSCLQANTRLNALNILKEEFLKYLELAQTGATTPAEAKDALERAKQLKIELESGMAELSRELVVEITVHHALNPYAEALKEAGLPADHPECAEQKEMIFNLDTVIERNCARYTEQNLSEWTTDIQNNKDQLIEAVSTPEEMKKIEKRMLAGMIPIVMPGRQAQMKKWDESLKNLKPEWIENGKPKVVENSFIDTNKYNEKMTDPTTDPANSFFRSVPDRPYIVWTKPTTEPDPGTTLLDYDQQKEELTKLHKEKPDLYDDTDLIPTEYAALQSLHTQEVQEQYTKHNPSHLPQNLTPLDKSGYTRFISSGLFSDGTAPCALFLTGDSRLHFSKSDVEARSRVGFRPAARS